MSGGSVVKRVMETTWSDIVAVMSGEEFLCPAQFEAPTGINIPDDCKSLAGGYRAHG